MPISSAIGPLTIAHSAAPPVLVSTVWRLKASSNIASSAATTTGKYSGRQPAMTALIAACSIVTPRPRAGRKPISVSGSSASTRSSMRLHAVGRRRDDRQPVGPAALEELLLDVELLDLQALGHEETLERIGRRAQLHAQAACSATSTMSRPRF